MNPYLVPGLARPDDPLCPFTKPDHETYYLPVDNTEQAFKDFHREIGDLSNLRTEGRLVVVSGEPRCGKTALINRCAAWLQRELIKVGLHGEIFPLAHEGAPNQSVDDRVLHVFSCITDDLQQRKLLHDDHFKELRARMRNVDLAFRYLSGILDEKRVLIILLPPSADLIKETVQYAKFGRKKIIFFAESDYVDIVRRDWPSIQSAGPVPPIILEVGILDDNDGWLFADNRQELHARQPHAIPFRKVTKEAMGQFTSSLQPSIGQLQAILHDFYREQSVELPQGDAVPASEVTFEDLAEFYLRLSRPETRRTR